MLDYLPCRFVLIAVLVGTVASAKERVPQLRNVTFPHRPDQVARPVYVAGEIATVLHFEQNVDPARTKLEGWEGRFEPLGVAGQSVVIIPLHDLTPEDRLPLVVTLVDGTQVPITVTADKDNVDHQVNMVWDPESVKYLRANLENALWREQRYREENERYERERKSPDHALAALLASGAERQTSFTAKRSYIYNNDGQTDIGMTVYSGRGKAAVVIKIKNHLDRFWNLSQARLTSATDFWQPFSKTRECAVTMEPHSIAPGATGVVAIVADRRAFTTTERGEFETLALQLIRDDGLVEAFVKLEPALARQ
ncbi:DUF2381 family protein [Stigmatella hybrida]|uniref:DUF2381 family protein n=1 Tax=Stigmatella hybrida TaxID=394097 RepID=UPI001CDB135E|nr:DUF2381 family protein [Stigmatella hybrida]